MKNIEKLQNQLTYKFKDLKLLKMALTHKSVDKTFNNERLEFLGDAVMDLIVAEYLYKKFNHIPEGYLSKLRAALVNEKSFSKIAHYLHIGENIFVSNAEEHNNGRNKDSLLSDAFEAIVGAIYLEDGLETCKKITINILEIIYPNIDLETLAKDYKTSLQEITQANLGLAPEYKLISAKGPDHAKEFEIGVYLNHKKIASACGKSKKEAEQKAAQKALGIIG